MERRSFGSRLQTAMEQRGKVCLGIDPHPAVLQAWGLQDTVSAAERFSRSLLEASADLVPVVKPQVALFERFGAAGFAVLERLLSEARREGVLTIADAKRGDIGSTMAGYAAAWLDSMAPLASDALTLSPYLGFEALSPAIAMAEHCGSGVFVVALSSNSEGVELQSSGSRERGGAVAARIIQAAQRKNAPFPSWGPVGLVIGAQSGAYLRKWAIDLETFNGPILAPGYGAQGAQAESVRSTFAAAYDKVIIASSRALAAAGPKVQLLREAIVNMGEQTR